MISEPTRTHWWYLWLQFQQVVHLGIQVFKVSAHCHMTDQDDAVDYWAVQGNNAADRAATQARNLLPPQLWETWETLKQHLDKQQLWADYHTMLANIGTRAVQSTQHQEELAPGLPDMLAAPMTCDAGLVQLANCTFDDLPVKCRTDEARHILAWLHTMTTSTAPVCWISFHQLLFLFQRHSGRLGPKPQPKRRGVTWAANSLDDNYTHRTQVQWFNQFLCSACRTLGSPLDIQQRQAPSHILGFWSGSIKGRATNADLKILDTFLRNHLPCLPARLVKHLDDVPPFSGG